MSFPSAIGALLRQLYFRYFFRDLGERCIFGDKLRILGEKNISIGSFTWIDHNVQLNASFGELKIGDRVHIAPYSILSAGGGIYIDDFVGISSFAHIYSHSEIPLRGKKMSGPMVEESQKGFKSAPVRLEVFFGSKLYCLARRYNWTGAVVGANSVVTKSVEPWTIVNGNPAKKVGRRLAYNFFLKLLELYSIYRCTLYQNKYIYFILWSLTANCKIRN